LSPYWSSEVSSRPDAAAETIHYLLSEALRRKLSGVMLKDERVKGMMTEMGNRIGNES